MELSGNPWPPQLRLLSVSQLVLRLSDYRRLMDASLRALPREACGLLSAQLKEDIAYLSLWLTSNEDPRPRRFRISGQTVKAVAAAARLKKEVLAGVFHSHPYQPPIPSPTDRRLAKSSAPLPVWLICAPHRSELRAYINTGKVLRQVRLRIRQDTMFNLFQS